MSGAANEKGLVVNLVADFVCPWCLIGSHRIDQAVAAVAEKRGPGAVAGVRVAHHPFLLDANTPEDGYDLRAQLAKKFGGDPSAMFSRVERVAQESGLPLDFSKVRRMCSTVKAHSLVQHAHEVAPALQRPLVKAIYRAYFFDGLDIGEEAVLRDLAAEVGLEGSVADAAFTADELRETREEARVASEQGITGVPFFVVADKYAVSGAQPVSVLVEALERGLG
jgi:predicted DsbA family dithiol-disulfide isomerase